MSRISIFNDVLGPVMRGPSSSHTAGSFNIARLAVDLLGGRPARARIAFDPDGSYGRVFRQQGVDRAFALGLLGWPLTDSRFDHALDLAASEGLDLAFELRPLAHADHPNTVEIRLETPGTLLPLTARSIGGGAVEIVNVNGWPVRLTGETHEVLVEIPATERAAAIELLAADGQASAPVAAIVRDPSAGDNDGHRSFEQGVSFSDTVLLHAHRAAPLASEARQRLRLLVGQPNRPPNSNAATDSSDPADADRHTGRGRPIFAELQPLAFVKRGPGLFSSAAEMIALAESRAVSLGQLALAHEASLLGLAESEVFDHMRRRLEVMRAAVAEGLSGRQPAMRLLAPSADSIFGRESRGELPVGGLHTRAAARALAAMHVNSGMGVVCAAPTGGSAGVLPGVIVTLLEDGRRLSAFGSRLSGLSRQVPADAGRDDWFGERDGVMCLFAAGAVGIVVASRATFAAEVAGCQVEIGAAGAMAAAAVVEAAGGSARQAADAAAIALQNTMGSVCDLVQGLVEIPCHTRNAAAASSAFVCADLVVGGYQNPIPLDETVDAVLAVGRMLPSELRCTARGGLAVTPSALRLWGQV